jgi:hypothetical protein
MTWKEEIKKYRENGRDPYIPEELQTDPDDLASRFKTSRADFMKEVPTAYKALQKAILHLEIVGHGIMNEAIDGHRPMSSLDLDSHEVIEVLKEFKTALIKINADSKSEK